MTTNSIKLGHAVVTETTDRTHNERCRHVRVYVKRYGNIEALSMTEATYAACQSHALNNRADMPHFDYGDGWPLWTHALMAACFLLGAIVGYVVGVAI